MRNNGCVRGGKRGLLSLLSLLSLSSLSSLIRCLLAWTGAGKAVRFAIYCLHAVTTQGVACVEVAGGMLYRRPKARGVERTRLRGVAQ